MKNAKREIVLWSCNPDEDGLEFRTRAEAVESAMKERGAADLTPIPLYGYARMEVEVPPFLDERVLEEVLDEFDSLYAGDEGSESTPAMQAAVEAFLEIVRKEYVPWACELVHTEKVSVEQAMKMLQGG